MMSAETVEVELQDLRTAVRELASVVTDQQAQI
jgi:hypothetical protein